MLATISVQPHAKSKITPQRLLPFPWDKPKGRHTAEGPKEEKLTAAERKKRFEEAVKRLGRTY